MPPPAFKDKNKQLHTQPINPILAVGFLAVFAFLVGAYIVANFKYFGVPANMNGTGIGAGATVSGLPASPKKTVQILPFKSSDDFKSYLDDGKRAFGDGVFAAQNIAAANAAAKAPAAKSAAKNQKPDASAAIAVAEARKFFSLGADHSAAGADIFGIKGPNLFFSPENQFYSPDPGLANGFLNGQNETPRGETKIFDISPPDSIAQTNFIPRDGNLSMSGDILAIFSGNSIAAYDISNATVPHDAWQARISDGTVIVDAKSREGKMYLGLRTKIDEANPCPAKPLVFGEKPFIIDCKSIYRPEGSILADSIFSVLKINLSSGAVDKNVSFVGAENGSAVFIGDNAIYAVWGQGGDYISFFTEFLRTKCKSLIPNYLLEKAAILPQYDIALSSKELELRALLSNWIATLNAEEQKRIIGEINSRMKDYLRDRNQDYEKTGIAMADMGSLEFVAQAEIPGRVLDASMIDERGGNVRMMTVSGVGAAQKMAWLVTGQVTPEDSQKILNNVYAFDEKLSIINSADSLDLPAGICAAKFEKDRVYVSTCRPDDNLYSIGLAAPLEFGLPAKLPAGTVSYLGAMEGGMFLNLSRNNRKIQVSLFDASLPAKSSLLSKYDLNDYWADMDANFQAFAIDGENKDFFVPAGRGGYIFSLESRQIVFKKTVGSFAVSRAFFNEGNLYLAGDDAIEVFGGADWSKLKSIKF